ncbi:hypothetical protein NTG1052_20004 [Candidatus Nitrotoga sp. 1052]|nr:hypothetical protein NTG1052_20004 [Candidatus Nitrotoga sp. 1052]
MQSVEQNEPELLVNEATFSLVKTLPGAICTLNLKSSSTKIS